MSVADIGSDSMGAAARAVPRAPPGPSASAYPDHVPVGHYRSERRSNAGRSQPPRSAAAS